MRVINHVAILLPTIYSIALCLSFEKIRSWSPYDSSLKYSGEIARPLGMSNTSEANVKSPAIGTVKHIAQPSSPPLSGRAYTPKTLTMKGVNCTGRVTIEGESLIKSREDLNLYVSENGCLVTSNCSLPEPGQVVLLAERQLDQSELEILLKLYNELIDIQRPKDEDATALIKGERKKKSIDEQNPKGANLETPFEQKIKRIEGQFEDLGIAFAAATCR